MPSVSGKQTGDYSFEGYKTVRQMGQTLVSGQTLNTLRVEYLNVHKRDDVNDWQSPYSTEEQSGTWFFILWAIKFGKSTAGP